MANQNMIHRILKAGISSYGLRRTLVWAVHVAIFAFSGIAAFLLRFDFSLPRDFRGYLIIALPIWFDLAARISEIDLRSGSDDLLPGYQRGSDHGANQARCHYFALKKCARRPTGDAHLRSRGRRDHSA
jgi:hypothetical protein